MWCETLGVFIDTFFGQTGHLNEELPQKRKENSTHCSSVLTLWRLTTYIYIYVCVCVCVYIYVVPHS